VIQATIQAVPENAAYFTRNIHLNAGLPHQPKRNSNQRGTVTKEGQYRTRYCPSLVNGDDWFGGSVA
jgi:hypothetical protein